jgi:hypothetical protein
VLPLVDARLMTLNYGITVTVHLTLNYGDSAFNSRFTSRRAARRTRFVEAIQSDLPCPALPSKTFPFPASPNQTYIRRRPVPIRGALAIVTNVGMGCGGRGSVGRVK